jgi:GT2 family glycosyltransferase
MSAQNPPDFAVHIVTHHSARTLERCLRSVLMQQHVTYSVLVVDNASTDRSVECARSLGIEVIANSTNLGYAAAHNQAITHTQSRYILTLNPDAQLEPNFLFEIFKALEAHPQAGSAAGCLLRVDHLDEAPAALDSAGLFMRRNRRQGLRHENTRIDQRPIKCVPIFGPDGAAAVYRRAMLEDIRIEGEVFDGDFFLHKEDVDVCWRAQLRGWSSVYVPSAVGHHIRGFRPGQRERVNAHTRHIALRNRYLLMLKNDQFVHMLRDLPYILIYDLSILLYVLLFERSSLAAYIDVIRLLPRMLRKRRCIQRTRRVDWRAIDRAFRL